MTIERNSICDQLKRSQNHCESLQTNNVQMNLKLGALKANLQRMTSQYNICNTKLFKSLNECNEINAKFDQMQVDLAKQMSIMKEKDVECLKLSKEIMQATKERDAALKRIYNIDAQKDEMEQKLIKLR